MLASHPIDPMILATDLAVAREFYGGRIGLPVLIATDDFLTFGCGGDSRLVVTRSSTGTSEPQIKASWRVDSAVNSCSSRLWRLSAGLKLMHVRHSATIVVCDCGVPPLPRPPVFVGSLTAASASKRSRAPGLL